MCIMEVRTGENTTTQIQAEYHNANTIQTDLDMLRAVMEARQEHERRQGRTDKVDAYAEAMARTRRAQDLIARGAGYLLDSYRIMLTVADNPDTHARKEGPERSKDTTPEVGNVLGPGNVHAWERDSAKAARYETRK